jgi:branched-chain amino acid transport system substrate-binding protein
MNSFKSALLAAAAATVLGTAAAAAADSSTITIGVAGPMSGSEAQFGDQFRRGATKAVEDLNAKGGVLGRKIELVVGDDACDPKQAVSVANDMVSKNAVFVTGHYCSGSSIPASDVYAEANIIQMTPASTAPKFTERGMANVFRICGRDDAQGPTAAKYVTDHFKDKKIAIVHDKSTYGKGLADEFQKQLNALGTKEVLYDAITAGEKDYSPLVSKLKEVKADIIYFGGYKTEGGLIVRQMHQQGIKATLIGGDALVTEDFWHITGPDGEGTMMTFGPDPRLNPANAALVKAFRDQNYEPEAYTLYTYAAVQSWAQAAQKAGSTDATKVESALRSGQFDTALGKIGYDAKGDVTAPGYVFYVWHDGKYIYAQ